MSRSVDYVKVVDALADTVKELNRGAADPADLDTAASAAAAEHGASAQFWWNQETANGLFAQAILTEAASMQATSYYEPTKQRLGGNVFGRLEDVLGTESLTIAEGDYKVKQEALLRSYDYTRDLALAVFPADSVNSAARVIGTMTKTDRERAVRKTIPVIMIRSTGMPGASASQLTYYFSEICGEPRFQRTREALFAHNQPSWLPSYLTKEHKADIYRKLLASYVPRPGEILAFSPGSIDNNAKNMAWHGAQKALQSVPV